VSGLKPKNFIKNKAFPHQFFEAQTSLDKYLTRWTLKTLKLRNKLVKDLSMIPAKVDITVSSSLTRASITNSIPLQSQRVMRANHDF
jgi:hypothetical protein